MKIKKYKATKETRTKSIIIIFYAIVFISLCYTIQEFYWEVEATSIFRWFSVISAIGIAIGIIGILFYYIVKFFETFKVCEINAKKIT